MIPIRLSPRVSMARLTSAIISTTGSGDTALKSSIQKCPAIDVTPTHSAPAETRRFVSRLYMAVCATASFRARFLKSVGVSACTMVNSSVAFFLANVEINRR